MNTVICNATPREVMENNRMMGAESYVIAIDSCCSYSIAKKRSDFIGKMTTCSITIQGFMGKSKIAEKGTWKFKMEDDDGMTHDVLIANTLYAPKAPFHLLSPQHWSQQSDDPSGTYCIIRHDKMILKWNGAKLQRQIKLDKKNNCGFIYSSPSCNKYHKFSNSMNSIVEIDHEEGNAQAPEINGDEEAERYHPVTPFDFDVDKDFDTEQKEEDKIEEGKLLLWKWHIRLNHLPFKKIKLLAEQGRLQKRLIKAEIPFCPTCTYSKATRKHGKGKVSANR